MIQKKISLYLITGFLGSGKTTLMKKLISHLKERKIAVIVNEFGPRSVDSSLLSPNGFSLSEINEGSVFCTCKSDAFIEAIWYFSRQDIDILLVETSGMADPSSIPSILSVVRKKTDRIDYRGCITIASAVNIHKLLHTSLFVQGQVKRADVLILNKIDQVTKETLVEREKVIRQYNPLCNLYKTSFCNLHDINDILHLTPFINDLQVTPTPCQQRYTSGTRQFLLEMSKPVALSDLLRFLESVRRKIYRVKGFAAMQDGKAVLVDGVTENIDIKPFDSKVTDFFLVFIYPDNHPMHHIISKEYRKIFS